MSLDMNLRIKTARLFRAARKLNALTQIDVSKKMDIAQGTVSKLESSILEPNAAEWYKYCLITGLEPDLTFRTGLIFNKVTKGLAKKAKFKLPKNKSGEMVTVKECIPFVNAIRELGLSNEFDAYLKANTIDRDVFTVVNFEIPALVMQLILEFIDTHLTSKKIEKANTSSIIRNLYSSDNKGLATKSKTLPLEKLVLKLEQFEGHISYKMNNGSISLSIQSDSSQLHIKALGIKAKILASICESEYNYNVELTQQDDHHYMLQLAA